MNEISVNKNYNLWLLCANVKKNSYQANLPIEVSQILNVRKLHNSEVHNIYLLQYKNPP